MVSRRVHQAISQNYSFQSRGRSRGREGSRDESAFSQTGRFGLLLKVLKDSCFSTFEALVHQGNAWFREGASQGIPRGLLGVTFGRMTGRASPKRRSLHRRGVSQAGSTFLLRLPLHPAAQVLTESGVKNHAKHDKNHRKACLNIA
jgi:hypothetical protein